MFLAVFGLAKATIIFINEWFVDRSASTIGVDVSAYQGEVDMARLMPAVAVEYYGDKE